MHHHDSWGVGGDSRLVLEGQCRASAGPAHLCHSLLRASGPLWCLGTSTCDPSRADWDPSGPSRAHISHPQGLPEEPSSACGRVGGSAVWACPMCEGGFLGDLAAWACPYVCRGVGLQGVTGAPQTPRTSRDTLNPKMLSCSCRSLFSRVLFPAPEGPLRTTGLGPDIPMGKWEQRSAVLWDPRGWGGCSCTPPKLSQELNRAEGHTKAQPHLPELWTPWHQTHGLPSCALPPHPWRLGFCSWEGHIWVPTPASPGTMPQRWPRSRSMEPNPCSGNFH